ncbi:MAG: hypothetical protein ABI134_20480, partial [Byssovorax sp.]
CQLSVGRFKEDKFFPRFDKADLISIGPLEGLGLLSKAGFSFGLQLFAEVKKGAIVTLPSSERRRLQPGEAAEVVALPYREDSDEKPEPPLLLRGMHNERMSVSAAEWTSMVGGKLEVRGDPHRLRSGRRDRARPIDRRSLPEADLEGRRLRRPPRDPEHVGRACGG